MYRKMIAAVPLSLLCASLAFGAAMEDWMPAEKVQVIAQNTEAVKRTPGRIPEVTPETKEKILNVFRNLQSNGFSGIEWVQMFPLGVRLLKVPLQLVTAPGAASYFALLPYGALTPTAP